MIATKKIDLEKFFKSVGDYNSFFLIGCSCSTSGHQQMEEMKNTLTAKGKIVTGDIIAKTTCIKLGIKVELKPFKDIIDKTDCLLIMSCSTGTQTLRELYPIKPIYNTNDTFSSGTSAVSSSKYVTTIGNGLLSEFKIVHNFGTRNVLMSIRETDAPFSEVYADVEMTTVDACTVRFSPTIPTANQFTVTILEHPSCSLCTTCVLDKTGRICPTKKCPKGILNGPCGGCNNGKCEIDSNIDCVWISIYERMKHLNRLGEFCESIIPPKDWSASIRKRDSKYTTTFGDGIATSFVITHNLNTSDVIVSIREVATNEVVCAEVSMTTVNTITISGFLEAPIQDQFRVTIIR